MKIYQSIKDLVTQQRVAKAAATLKENESDVAKAISQILPSMLGALYTKGATTPIKDTIQLAGKHNIIKDLNGIYEGSGVIEGINFGERFENDLIGSRNSAFPKSISKHSGISVDNADRLGNWVAATIAAWFGEMTVRQGHSLATLINDLGKEKSEFSKDIPEGVACELNLLVPGACVREEDKKKSNTWIWWLVVILILLVLAVLIFRGCDRNKSDETRVVVETEKIDVHKDGTVEIINRTLSNGLVISVPKDGAEEQMIDFLDSNRFKNAKAGSDELRERWFHFDYIDFEHNSATSLTAGSRQQLVNIAAILKLYPDAKIMVGGYADRTGSKAVNDEISKERAEYVKKVLVDNGIAAARVSTEGFGKEFAKFPADAPDSQRVLDRSIALRLDK